MKQYLYAIIQNKKKGILPCIIKIGLWIISGLYRMIVSLRNFFYTKGIFSVCLLERPVISVGNIVMGGSGKTPLVKWIADVVKEIAKSPVILTRGYMLDKNSLDHFESDEALMLSKQLKDVEVLVGADRAFSAQEYLREHQADVFIMDDGFQHRSLKRDLDIVVIDASNPWGNGFLIPRGMLREPISAIRRADCIVLTKTDIGSGNVESIREKINDVCKEKLIVETVHEAVGLTELTTGEPLALAYLQDKDICAFASIGNPEAFSETLKRVGAQVKESVCFLDHYVYEGKDADQIIDVCLANHVDGVVTTRKDAVKITHLVDHFKGKIKLICLDVQIQVIEGRDELIERINRLF